MECHDDIISGSIYFEIEERTVSDRVTKNFRN